MTYKEAVAYIEEVPKFAAKTELANTVELMERLGRPDRAMPIVHVAGTNGKGSVCAFLSAMLQSGGQKVGLFTSPHLVRTNERFQVNGQMASDADFLESFSAVSDAVSAMQKDGFAHPAYFELLFAMGMYLFRKWGVDILVMETGLGGRLDATNIVEHPIATVITSIGLDHTEYLGDTIQQIAAEKAGILKEGVPVVFDGRKKEAADVILAYAKRAHAPATALREEMYEILCKTEKSIDFAFPVGYDLRRVYTVPFPAEYQVGNAALALLAMDVIDKEGRISAKQRAEALLCARWPGRMETVLPGVIVDGAHNADGVREFARTLRQVRQDRVVLLFACVADKDYGQMVAQIADTGKLGAVVATEVWGSRKVPAETLAGLFRKYVDVPVFAIPDVREAFAKARNLQKDGLLFCAGSLYLVGEIKAMLG